MGRPLHPIVVVIVAALQAEGAYVQPTRYRHEPLDADLELRSKDGRRVIVNIKEQP